MTGRVAARARSGRMSAGDPTEVMSASMMDTQQSNGPAMPAANADGEGLSVLHSRLAAHFRDLREHRDAVGHGAPIFALEHGLPDADLALLKAGILSAVRQRRLPKESWLPLVVYAAELGYPTAAMSTGRRSSPGHQDGRKTGTANISGRYSRSSAIHSAERGRLAPGQTGFPLSAGR